ncbi:MAG: GntR family transcriptional regulator [Pyrinomonadaceae bacterium]|nr:GntR family transcriptional regulator [Pyrinomonadaceae bacterium]
MMLNIQLKDRTEGPVYLQVRNQIEAQIRDKGIASGESLPQPSALAQKLSVDKGEIQRAYFELEQLGLIKKSARKDFLSGREVITYSVS